MTKPDLTAALARMREYVDDNLSNCDTSPLGAEAERAAEIMAGLLEALGASGLVRSDVVGAPRRRGQGHRPPPRGAN